MKNKGLLYLLTTWLVIFTSCKSDIPKGVIPPEEMKTIVFDLLVAEQIERADTNSAVKLHLRDSTTHSIRKVLAIHGITREDYMKSLDFYEANPDKLKKLLDSTKSYGAILQDTLRKKMRESNRPLKLDSLVSPDSVTDRVNDSNKTLQKRSKLPVTADHVPAIGPTA